jgi:peptidoglycan/xylan/chitin deacetylase (PgdA/CDA1 family)
MQSAIRRLHVMTAGTIPPRLAIYFHDLPEKDWDSFRSFVAFLRDGGYSFTDPTGICAEGDDKRVMLSFDDCFRSWWQAVPLFAELEVSATFYINTEPLRDRADEATTRAYFSRIGQNPDTVDSLSSTEIRDLATSGHAIGAHTHTHPNLGAVPDTAAREEITRSRMLLEEIVEAPVVHFSYPYGMRRNFNDGLRQFCLSDGFETVANAIPGLLHVGQNLSAIQRTGWHLDQTINHNIDNLRIDGRRFEKLTGRSAAPF